MPAPWAAEQHLQHVITNRRHVVQHVDFTPVLSLWNDRGAYDTDDAEAFACCGQIRFGHAHELGESFQAIASPSKPEFRSTWSCPDLARIKARLAMGNVEWDRKDKCASAPGHRQEAPPPAAKYEDCWVDTTRRKVLQVGVFGKVNRMLSRAIFVRITCSARGSWSSSSAIRLSPSQIRAGGFPAPGSSRG